MKIAVLLNEKNRTAVCGSSGIVNIYTKDRGQWNTIERIPFDIYDRNDAVEIRKKFIDMIDALDDCRVFVSAESRKIFYSILDSRGVSIWSIEGYPEEFLEHVLKSEEKSNIEKGTDENKKILTPVEIDKLGNYYMDLRTVMEHNEGVNSKDVLIPFLCNGNFNELQVDCIHVPHWFKYELEKMNLQFRWKKLEENLFRVFIYHICKNSM